MAIVEPMTITVTNVYPTMYLKRKPRQVILTTTKK